MHTTGPAFVIFVCFIDVIIGRYRHPYYVGPCHCGMTCPWVLDAGNSLQILRVAVNTLNKQSQTANNGWSCSLGVGQGDNNST